MDEERKQRLLVALVAFNLTVIVVCIVLWWLDAFADRSATGALGMTLLISAPIGAAVGGAIYYFTGLSQ